jgi:hypothetical protein
VIGERDKDSTKTKVVESGPVSLTADSIKNITQDTIKN